MDEKYEKNEQINKFFEEKLKIEMGVNISKGELYDTYREWCRSKEIWSLRPATFSILVRNKYKDSTPKDARDTKTKKRIWRNMRII